MDDDLNTAEALAAVFEYVRDANTRHGCGRVSRGQSRPPRSNCWRVSTRCSTCCSPPRQQGRLRDAEVEALIAERTAGQEGREFRARRPDPRASLLEQGIILEDTKDGVRWKRK